MFGAECPDNGTYLNFYNEDDAIYIPPGGECDDCNDLKNRVKTLEDCCSGVETDIQTMSGRIDDTETDISSLERDVSQKAGLNAVTSIVQNDTEFTVNHADGSHEELTLPENTANSDGIVPAPTSSNSYWGTDAYGEPGWREFRGTVLAVKSIVSRPITVRYNASGIIEWNINDFAVTGYELVGWVGYNFTSTSHFTISRMYRDVDAQTGIPYIYASVKNSNDAGGSSAPSITTDLRIYALYVSEGGYEELQ